MDSLYWIMEIVLRHHHKKIIKYKNYTGNFSGNDDIKKKVPTLEFNVSLLLRQSDGIAFVSITHCEIFLSSETLYAFTQPNTRDHNHSRIKNCIWWNDCTRGSFNLNFQNHKNDIAQTFFSEVHPHVSNTKNTPYSRTKTVTNQHHYF